MSLAFNLRFSLSEIKHWADLYSYQDDTQIEQMIGPRSKAQGFFSREDFVELCGWKSKRPRKFCLLNTESEVKSATSIALVTSDERLRMDSLRSLHGVEMRTASALLHFAGRDRYPILDVRALWSLNISEAPSYYGFNLWWSYT